MGCPASWNIKLAWSMRKTKPGSETRTSRAKKPAPMPKPISLPVVTTSHSLFPMAIDATIATGHARNRRTQIIQARRESFLLPERREHDTHRLPDLNAGSRRCQTPGLLVDAKDNDAVRILVGGQQIIPGRVNAETARGLALSGSVFDVGKPACFFVNAENDNRVMAPVGAIKKSSRRMGSDFRRAVIRLDGFTLRQG